MADDVQVRIYRGDDTGGEMTDYRIPRVPGMVVLDVVLAVQAAHAPDLGVRWNCKAGKCGSCSAEVDGKPRLMCMDRVDHYAEGEPISIRPLKTFPVLKDLVCDVSWNFKVNAKVPSFSPPDGKELTFSQDDAERSQEFRKCIECFLCQDVCHVLRDHEKKEEFGGPRFFVRTAGLEMHPRDEADRLAVVKDDLGIGYCNITKCCTEVCPEDIQITDNAIIPLKERVVDRYYDPVRWLLRKLRGKT